MSGEPTAVDFEGEGDVVAEGADRGEVIGVKGVNFTQDAVLGEEAEVEGDVGVFHPEGAAAGVLINEEHAVLFGEVGAVHESGGHF